MNEQELKTRLTDVFNALMQVETKGRSTLIITDCIRELENVIRTPIVIGEKEESDDTD